MTTCEIRKLERILEEQSVDYDTTIVIIETALAHNRMRAAEKIEQIFSRLPVASPPPSPS